MGLYLAAHGIADPGLPYLIVTLKAMVIAFDAKEDVFALCI
ncbi:hypothetical protein AVDCRST_MAG81-1136 [uncultured Synechococcales cyanobacterium]|uniref:Uncharacterized protein n=1 Tax=uncultured Synechococcales cyanobacterium TaxID=1936017 RepID=A0A6J4V542_9CYAN|nr:hypothetical protein AVDCRST_MAG81-1136 [uncultured Synechococcales cyanobacterium]